jgi:5-methyltetrahydrofolate--homocysteine methyltransferase
MTEFGGVRVIGERINPTGKKKFQQALREENMNYIMEQAIQQQEAGADVLDVNVGLPDLDEPAMMYKVVRAVQSVVDLPVQIDSSNPEAIEAGLRAAAGRAIVNSVNGEKDKMDAILPLVRKYGAAMVALTMDEEGIPTTAEKRVEIAHRIIAEAASYGIPREDILVDCLTLTVSAQQDQAMETLRAMRTLRNEGYHLVLGVSNISFGLPARVHVNRSFLTMAMYCGLDFAIVNPNQKEIMDAIYAFRVFSCEDRNCTWYIERFKDEKPAAAGPNPSLGTRSGAAGGTAPAAEVAGAGGAPSGPAGGTDARGTDTGVSGTAAGGAEARTLEDAILRGLKEEAASITGALLAEMDGMALINERIIPALDLVGAKYETGELFLPQLINAANAACAGLDLIKSQLSAAGDTIQKEKVILATVKGDIHDIGKNIVKVILENYGYQVIDLGRDVDPETIVEKAVRENVRLIGLSALMTTTVGAMEDTIRALRESGHECRIMVGGAVLTEEYAGEIGADRFVRDAKASADTAKEILG